jgi:peptide/nickel transport system permease protein
VGGLIKFLAMRVFLSLATIFAGAFIVFITMKAAPGDPAAFVLGDFATPAAVAKFRSEHHLDEPLLAQLWSWLAGMVHGDFGLSLSLYPGREIGALLLERVPATVFVCGYALVISIIVSLVLGSIAALRHGRPVDTGITAISVFGISMPDFWLGYILVLLFALEIGWFPAYGFVSPASSISQAFLTATLPAIAIAAPIAGSFVRVLRVSLLETADRDYVRAGNALGLNAGFVFVHYVLRNALIPFVTMVGLQVRFLLGGVVVIERIFGVPGIGSLMVDATFARDYLVVEACTVTFLIVVIAANLLTDIACTLLDPRRAR